MVDLTTRYMGLTLKHPVVPSATPLTKSLSGIRELEDAGAAAITMYSLFEEQIEMEALNLHQILEQRAYSNPEATSYFPDLNDFNRGPDGYLDLIRDAKAAVDVPVIGSLNGITPGGWVDYARKIEQAGADALELNIYYLATRPEMDCVEVERLYLAILREVKNHVRIPVAVKLSPFFSALPNIANKLDAAGADALVLFNRFYQPDLDLDELAVVPNLVLSQSSEMRLPLRWIAILYGHVKASLALTTGIHTPQDALKAVAAGADVANVCSLLLHEGPAKIAWLVDGMRGWLEEHEYESVTQLKGSMSQASCCEPGAFERANYMKILNSFRVMA